MQTIYTIQLLQSSRHEYTICQLFQNFKWFIVSFLWFAKMPPIVIYIDFIFSKYFNEFLQYNYIKSLQLPIWLYALTGLFVLVMILWILDIVQGLIYLFQRLLNNSKSSNGKNHNGKWRQSNRDNTIDKSNSDLDDAFRSKFLNIHISARKPIQQISSENVATN